MKAISDFLVEHWQIIGSALLFLCSFIISIFRKRPKAYDYMDYCQEVLSYIPSFINQAEEVRKTGSSKLSFVIQKCLDKLTDFVKCDDEQLERASKFFERIIEAILSTPQKKGDN